MTYQIRPADISDAEPMSKMLDALAAIGKRSLPCDPTWVRENYIAHPNKISCFVAAEETGLILGLQSLRRAGINDPFGTPEGWATIGTHIDPNAARRGIGKALFVETLKAAKTTQIPAMDAKIGATNINALGYYGAMGFVTNPDFDDPGRKYYPMR